MLPASLSTMWMQRRFDRLVDFMAAAAGAGFHRFELSHTVTPEMFEGLAPGDHPISSFHDPCPSTLPGDVRRERNIQLAASDEEGRKAAVQAAKTTIDYACRFGAPVVVLHLGYVDVDLALSNRLRRLYDAGKRESREYRELQEEIAAARVLRREPCFAAALRSLAELRDYARERGIKLGLENRVHYHEIPSLEEVKDLLHAFADDTVYYWHDVGHAQVLQALGFTPHEAWLKAFGPRILGVHLHDVRGIHDHKIPGTGDVDFAMVRAYLPPEVIPVCEFDWPHSLEEIRAGHEYLAKVRVVELPHNINRPATI